MLSNIHSRRRTRRSHGPTSSWSQAGKVQPGSPTAVPLPAVVDVLERGVADVGEPGRDDEVGSIGVERELGADLQVTGSGPRPPRGQGRSRRTPGARFWRSLQSGRVPAAAKRCRPDGPVKYAPDHSANPGCNSRCPPDSARKPPAGTLVMMPSPLTVISNSPQLMRVDSTAAPGAEVGRRWDTAASTTAAPRKWGSVSLGCGAHVAHDGGAGPRLEDVRHWRWRPKRGGGLRTQSSRMCHWMRK